MQKVITLIVSVLRMAAPMFKKPDSIKGIKETVEAMIAGNEIGLFCCKRFKDGVQFEDFSAFYTALTTDGEFKSVVQKGYENYKLIPEEVKDIDAGEGCELAAIQAEYVPKYVEALKKEEPAPAEPVEPATPEVEAGSNGIQ